VSDQDETPMDDEGWERQPDLTPWAICPECSFVVKTYRIPIGVWIEGRIDHPYDWNQEEEEEKGFDQNQVDDWQWFVVCTSCQHWWQYEDYDGNYSMDQNIDLSDWLGWC
jgi:hypothetical protein